MPKRRGSIAVVIDTNVFVRSFLTRSRRSPNRVVLRSWLVERKFKLALSDDIKEEYMRIFQDVLGLDKEKIASWRKRFGDKRIARTTGVGTSTMSRDPEDNVFIATATAAKAKFLVKNDRDLLDIADADRRRLRFDIVTPERFLKLLERFD